MHECPLVFLVGGMMEYGLVRAIIGIVHKLQRGIKMKRRCYYRYLIFIFLHFVLCGGG